MTSLNWIGCLVIMLISSLSAAQDITVFDVRTSFAMDNEQTTYRDYYINGGTETGLRIGGLIKVTRLSTVYDEYQNKSPGNLVVPVGELKLIHVQKGLSVARLHNVESRELLPLLEYDFVMVGDRVDISSLRFPQKKSAEAKPETKPKSEATPNLVTPEGSAEFSSSTPVFAPLIN